MCLLRYVGGAPTIRTFGLCVSYIFPLTRVFLADVIRLFSVWFSKQKKNPEALSRGLNFTAHSLGWVECTRSWEMKH